MALEQISETDYLFDNGLFGGHEHPRIFDGVVIDPNNPEVPEIDESRVGKAGVDAFTQTALQGGFVALAAMPNESLRLPGLSEKELEETGSVNNYNRTHTVPFPISNRDRALAAGNVIATQSNLPVCLIGGVDPLDLDPSAAKIRIDHSSENDRRQARKLVEPVVERFADMADLIMAAKIFQNLSTGGYMINADLAPYIIEGFYHTNPGKPFVNHVEGAGVFRLLEAVKRLGGQDWPIQIAHVSSEEELQGVIYAKQAGMNVTCEATPHHMFLSDDHSDRPDGLGCMAPSLKAWEHVLFLRKNFGQWIDFIGNDCAPHAYSDKRTGTLGVTNHPSTLNMFMGAALNPDEEWISPEDVEKKLGEKLYRRFGFPYLGGYAVYSTLVEPAPNTRYAATDPFAGEYAALGGVIEASAGPAGSSFKIDEEGKPVFEGRRMYSHFMTSGCED